MLKLLSTDEMKKKSWKGGRVSSSTLIDIKLILHERSFWKLDKFLCISSAQSFVLQEVWYITGDDTSKITKGHSKTLSSLYLHMDCLNSFQSFYKLQNSNNVLKILTSLHALHFPSLSSNYQYQLPHIISNHWSNVIINQSISHTTKSHEDGHACHMSRQSNCNINIRCHNNC